MNYCKQHNRKILPLLTLSILISFQSCKLDPPVYPEGGSSPETENPVSDNLSELYASTVISGMDKIAQPSRICTAPNGTLYISSYDQGKVYKVSKSGTVTTVMQQRVKPLGIKAAKNGDIYVVLTGENRIVKIKPSGAIYTISVGLALKGPQDLAIDNDGTLYIADTDNRRILKVTPTGQTSVFAGKTGLLGIKDGLGEQAHFSYLSSIRIAADGFIWVVDGDGVNKSGQTVRRITPKGQVNTYFFQKNKSSAISDIAVTKRDATLKQSAVVSLFLVYLNNTITNLGTNGVETPLTTSTSAGNTDGNLTIARFNKPSGITITDSTLYVIDAGNNALRRITRK